MRSGRGLRTLVYAAALGCFAVFAAGSAARGAQSPALRIGGIVPPPQQATRFTSSKAGPCDYVPACEQLTYHGGPVMHSSTTHAIYWLPTGYTSGDGMQPYDTNYQSIIAQYFTDLQTASGTLGNVYGVDTQYCDGVSFGSSTCTGASAGNVVTTNQTYGGSYVDTTTAFPADGCTDPTGKAAHCLTDGQLQTEIEHVITVMGWPKGTSNIYFLYTPEGVESCFDAVSGVCAYTYCAYHGSYGVGGSTVVYANQPYPKLANDPFYECGTGEYPNGDDADEQLNITSHEHREAITDPTLDAWYGPFFQYETSDQCAWDFGTESGSSGAKYNQTINGHHYDLQLEWSNDGSTCLASFGSGTGTSPPKISKISPRHGVVGQPIKISGKNLAGATTVTFNATDAASFTLKGNTITAPVPVGATTGPVHVTTAGGTADGPVFTVDPSPVPTIKKLKPSSAHAGSTVTITGKGFWGASAVQVNGVDAASFTVKSATKITFVVAGGNTTGVVSVTTPGGAASSVGSLTIS